MKKTLSALTAIALSAIVLAGCNPAPKAEEITPPPAPRPVDREQKIEIDFEGIRSEDIENILNKLPISGVRREFKCNPYGVYTVEYVHSPRDGQKDETLDYKLELRDDNTFDLFVTANGVQASHYGHWYMHRGGNITMYYDEPIDPTAHNIYVSDSLYGEMLCGGKIMIYENCNVVVLSRETENDVDPVEPPAEQSPTDGAGYFPQMFI